MSEVWGCASFLDVPQPGNRIRFVRACGRGEAACLRERDSISVAGRKIPEFCFASGSFALIEHSFLHGIFEFCSILTDICMGSMPSRNFVKVWHGFCRILYDLLIYCMGCMNVDGFLNVLYGFCCCLFVCRLVCPPVKMVEKVGPFHQFWAVSLNSLLCVWVFLI